MSQHGKSVRWIHPDAPAKPPVGAACNGCGVCCLWKPCPLGMVLSRRCTGACVALRWDDAQRRYRCGALLEPASALGWKGRPWPRWLQTWVRRGLARWIAAGRGCDADVQVESADP